MNKILILTILVGIFCLAGCGEMTPYQRQVWSDCFRDITEMQHQQNLAQMKYSQPQFGPIIYPGRSQNNSTYWQERYYKDKVQQKIIDPFKYIP